MPEGAGTALYKEVDQSMIDCYLYYNIYYNTFNGSNKVSDIVSGEIKKGGGGSKNIGGWGVGCVGERTNYISILISIINSLLLYLYSYELIINNIYSVLYISPSPQRLGSPILYSIKSILSTPIPYISSRRSVIK